MNIPPPPPVKIPEAPPPPVKTPAAPLTPPPPPPVKMQTVPTLPRFVKEHKLQDMHTTPQPPPPPPPMPAAPLQKKNNTTVGTSVKLKKSSDMRNLYLILREKLESSSNKKSTAKNNSSYNSSTGNTSNSGGGLGLVEEYVKRSAYFKKIEEDYNKYGSSILELQSALKAFKTTDMTELLKFHQHVEEQLDNLTDERKILLRFNDFPLVKLETLRMAAGTYHTLDGIVSTLKGWRFTAPSAMTPVSDQLDKIDSYFKKIRKTVDEIEMRKDADVKKFQRQHLTFDYNLVTRVKEEMVDVSSSCIEIALKESKKTKEAGTAAKCGSILLGTLWQVFQFAFRIYLFAGGQDNSANRLAAELACELQSYIET